MGKGERGRERERGGGGGGGVLVSQQILSPLCFLGSFAKWFPVRYFPLTIVSSQVFSSLNSFQPIEFLIII